MTDSVMELKLWPGDQDIPSIQFESLQFWTYAKIAGVPVKVCASRNPLWAPKGTLPVLSYNGKYYSTFSEIVSLFCSLKSDPDSALSPSDQTDIAAYTAMLKEKLYPAVQYTWWLDRKNYEEVSRPCYAKAVVWPLNFYYPGYFERKAQELMQTTFFSTENTDVIEAEIFTEAQKCLNALSLKLGDKKYFFGDHPSSFDATLYAYLTPTLKKGFPSKKLESHIRGCFNLVEYVDRITKDFFPQTVKEGATSKPSTSSSSQEIQTLTKKQHMIVSAVFAFTSMATFAYLTGILQFGEEDCEDDEENVEYNESSNVGSFYENFFG